MSITPIDKNDLILNNENIELNLKDIENSESSCINNIKDILEVKKEPILRKRYIDRFGDLTEIIKNNIKLKTMIDNKKAKSHKKNKSVLLTLSSSKKRKNKFNNINLITFTNSATKDSSQISLNSNYIKYKNIINFDLFINKKSLKNKNKSNTVVKKQYSIDKKKSNFNSMLNRFEEELQKTKKKLEAKKEKIKEKEKLIYTGKPNITKTNLKKYQKYSKDFLVRQKELNEELNKKKKKLIDQANKRKEEEYQIIISNSILNKNKRNNYIKSKSCDDWVERLYKKETLKRKMEQNYLEQSIKPSFKPFLPKKDIKKVINGDKNRINKVIKTYNKKANPQIIINYLNTKKNSENQNEELFRNKIFGKYTHKYINKKINNSMQ